MALKILYLEDNPTDQMLFDLYVTTDLPATLITLARTYSEFMRILQSQESFDVIVCDHRVPGFNELSAIHIAKKERPKAWVIFLTGARLDLVPKAEMSEADYALEKLGYTDLIAVLKECADKPKDN